jgi:hypothetical protein
MLPTFNFRGWHVLWSRILTLLGLLRSFSLCAPARVRSRIIFGFEWTHSITKLYAQVHMARDSIMPQLLVNLYSCYRLQFTFVSDVFAMAFAPIINNSYLFMNMRGTIKTLRHLFVAFDWFKLLRSVIEY